MNKKQEIIGMIETIAGKYNSYTVFCDWVKCCAIMVQNSLYPFFHDEVWEEREHQWLETIRKYSSREQQLFMEMFALLVEAMEEEMTDVLGQIFMEGDMGSKMTGQFFTPFHVSEMVARTSLHDSITSFDGKMMQLNEPSAGGGGFVIAAAKVMTENGINYHRYLDVIAQDLDWTAVYMCYLQLSLYGIKGIVVQGDSLRSPLNPKKESSRHIMVTPAKMGVMI